MSDTDTVLVAVMDTQGDAEPVRRAGLRQQVEVPRRVRGRRQRPGQDRLADFLQGLRAVRRREVKVRFAARGGSSRSPSAVAAGGGAQLRAGIPPTRSRTRFSSSSWEGEIR